MCPHKRAMVLSMGLVGETAEDESPGASKSRPYVSCPMHKKFSFEDGKYLTPKNEDKYRIETFEAKVDTDGQMLQLATNK
ncbi:hypothetical protein DFQ26_003114, partial [Actinomortierella ambigua]